MHIILMFHIVAVIPVLLDQMTPVGSRVDQDIVRPRFHTALDNSFQELVLDFKFLKRKIIHIDNKFIIPILDLCNHGRQILELMLVDLDHAQALSVKFIDNRLDAR